MSDRLEISFRIDMAQFKADMAAVESSMRGSGFAAGGAGGAPTVAGVGVASVGPSSAPAQAVQQRQAAAVQQQTANIRGYTTMSPVAGAGYGFADAMAPMGNVVSWGGGGGAPAALSGNGYGTLQGRAWSEVQRARAREEARISGEQEDWLRRAQERQVNPLVSSGEMPTMRDQPTPKKWWRKSVTEFVTGTTVEDAAREAGSSGGKGMGMQGKMGLRNLIYGTVYGLVADVVASSVGAASQSFQMQRMAGGRPGAEALASLHAPRAMLGGIPIVGSALSSLFGAFGPNEWETNVQLAELQDGADVQRTNIAYGTQQSRFARQAARSGGFGAIEAGAAGERSRIRQQTTQNQAAMNEWMKGHPAPVPGRDRYWLSGVDWWLSGSDTQWSKDWKKEGDEEIIKEYESWHKQFTEYKTGLTGKTNADMAALEARVEQEKRSFRSETMSTAAEVRRGTLSARFTPGAAAGRFAEESLAAQIAGLGPDYFKSPENVDRFRAQAGLIRNELVGGQYEAMQQIIGGRAMTYNPYTTSPVAFNDRSLEPVSERFDRLSAAIESLDKHIQETLSSPGGLP